MVHAWNTLRATGGHLLGMTMSLPSLGAPCSEAGERGEWFEGAGRGGEGAVALKPCGQPRSTLDNTLLQPAHL